MDVRLSKQLSFSMKEALFQKRPSQWAQVWHSALALSRWLLEQLPESLPVSSKELGCGVGLVSMTLAHLGVAAEGTDREPLALAYALHNARQNSLTGFTASHLDWSEPEGLGTSFAVASDILYEDGSAPRVFALLHAAGVLLPGGRLLLGGPNRRALPLDHLVSLCVDSGYAHLEETRSVDWDGRRDDIGIHVLTRPV